MVFIERVKPVFSSIVEQIASGKSISAAIEAHDVSVAEFYKYLRLSTSHDDEMLFACLIKSDVMAHETIRIADDETIDPMRARNMISARQWLASKCNPKRYGERLDVNVNATVDIKSALSEAKERAKLRDVTPPQLSNSIDDIDIFK